MLAHCAGKNNFELNVSVFTCFITKVTFQTSYKLRDIWYSVVFLLFFYLIMKIINQYFLKAGKNRAGAGCKIPIACLKCVTQFAEAVPSCAWGRGAGFCAVSFRNGAERCRPQPRARPFHLLSWLELLKTRWHSNPRHRFFRFLAPCQSG